MTKRNWASAFPEHLRGSTSTPPLRTRIVQAIGITALYWASYALLELLATLAPLTDATAVAEWWAPLGLSYALLLRSGVAYAPLCAVTTAAADYFFHRGDVDRYAPELSEVLLSLAVFSAVAWALRRRAHISSHLEDMESALLFLIGSGSGALVTAIAFMAWGMPGPLEMLGNWLSLYIAVLAIAPFFLAVVFPWAFAIARVASSEARGRMLADKSRQIAPQIATTLMWFGFVGGTLFYCFGLRSSIEGHVFYPLFLPVLVAAFWRGTKGAATGVITVAVGIAAFAHNAVQQFGRVEVELFLLTMTIMSYLLGASLTERRKSVEDLQSLHSIYRQAIAAMRGVPYVRDYDRDSFTYIGDGIESVTGFKAEEFTPALWEDRSRVTKLYGAAEALAPQEAIQRTRQGEFSTWSSEGRFLARDGTTRWFLDASVEIMGPENKPIRSIGLIQDITNVKAAEAALRASEEQKGLLLRFLPVCVFAATLKPRFSMNFVSPTVDTVTGYSEPNFLDSAEFWLDRIHPEDKNAVLEQLDRLGQDGAMSCEYRWRHADGVYRWFWQQAVLTKGQDGVEQAVGLWLDVTDRRRAEDAVRTSRAILHLFVEHAPAAVAMLDRDMRYVAVSKRWLQDYRLGDCDIIGRSHYDVFPEIRNNADWLDVHRRCLAGEVITREEDRFVRQDGSEDWLRWEIRPWYNDAGTIGGIIMYTELITERKRQQEALRKSQERLDLALSGAGFGMWDLVVPEGRMEVSASWAEMLGYTLENVPVGASFWFDQIHPDDSERMANHFWLHIVGEIPGVDIEFRVKSRTGRWVWIHVRGKVVARDETGVPVRITGTQLDITARKAAELERQAIEAQMQHTQKLESLGVLAGGIAHDFNNLLVGILGNADLALADLPAHSPVRDSLNDIVISAQRAADLCKQMLAYSGRGRFVVMPVRLNELVTEMSQLLGVTVSKRVNLQYDLSADDVVVQADATQIRQIIMNLLTNASEAIGDGQGIIRLATGATMWTRNHVTVNTYGAELVHGEHYAFLSIQDTGCGMDQATMDRVFDPFFTTKFTGRGLGMAAVLGIVRGHGGAIQIASTPGRGSVFTVYLPLSTGQHVEEKKPVVIPETMAIDGSELVLVVDDEEPVLQIACTMLARKGIRAITARDGEEALRVFEDRKDDIRLAILDLTMPRMSGGELLIELRRIKPDLRVLLSSGYDEMEAISQSQGHETAGFIQKPYRANEFYAMVQAALDGDRAQ